MNSAITQCPACSTRFKVTDEQLAAHEGMVRCGRCSTVFNAAEQLHSNQPSPQLNLPIATLEDEVPPAELELPADIAEQKETEHVEMESSSIAAIADEQETLEHQFQFHEELPAEEAAKPVRKPRRWPWVVGSTFLMLTLLAQALYFYRVEIAALLPGLKPALTSYCELLQCTIPLPKKADLMSIESSNLEADPQQPNIIIVSVLLHNVATYVQAYPDLELSLTDLQDKIVARRVFTPPQYLKAGESEKSGLAANREMSIQLRLDTFDLKPSGYKLFLFYPQ